MLYIYTGDGKGKTSAAVGLLTRSRGAGLSCAIIFFDKNPDYCNELGVLKQIGVEAYIFGSNRVLDSSFRFDNLDIDYKEAKDALATAKNIKEEEVDVLVLDEVLNGIRTGLLSLEDILEFIDNWPKEKYLVLTGRGLPIEIKERSYMISEILNIKHPFDNKENVAQAGIDY